MKTKQKIEKEFNEKFVVPNGGVMPKHKDFGRTLERDLKSHISSIRKDDIERLIGLLVDKKVPLKDFKRFINNPLHPVNGYLTGYNQAISDIITHLNNLKENI